MRTFDELEQLWSQSHTADVRRGTVHLLVARLGEGQHAVPSRAELCVERGFVGDRWAQGANKDPGRQLTLMNANVAALVCDGQPLHMPGDNILVDLDLSESNAPVGARIRVGAALVEVTDKPHLGCKKFTARFGEGAMHWVNEEAWRTRRLRGLNARIIEPAEVSVGDPVELLG